MMSDEGLPDFSCPAKLNAAAELLDRMVEKGFGPRPCLHAENETGSETWTYAKVLERANRLANLLTSRGLAPGERVLLRDANSPMMAACWFAVLKAGGIAVSTMPQLRAQELSGIIAKAQIKYALCSDSLSEELYKAQQTAPAFKTVVLYSHEEPAVATMLAGYSEHFETRETSHDDVALIAFTSGTSGDPKATMHFHRDLLAVCDSFSKYILKPEPHDIFCGSPPLAFTFGLGGLLLFPMRVGASTLLLRRATAETLLAAIERHGCTICFTAPTLYRAMLEHTGRYNLASLKKCVSAGERLPLETFEAWRNATGLRIIDGIGSTELLHIFISAVGDEIRPGSTGRPVPGYEAKVVDEAGSEVPPDTVGRLAVRGPTGCRYFEAPDHQRKYVQNGWNMTGDAYRMDADGYFWYEGRTDDMIVSSGYKISALEVEATLLSHPRVAECAVVGSPRADRGEIVKAFIVLKPDSELPNLEAHTPEAPNTEVPNPEALRQELQEYVKAQIAPYKYPRAIEFVTDLPRTSTGKLQRSRLREKEHQKASSHS